MLHKKLDRGALGLESKREMMVMVAGDGGAGVTRDDSTADP